jgi:hypothetical protein
MDLGLVRRASRRRLSYGLDSCSPGCCAQRLGVIDFGGLAFRRVKRQRRPIRATGVSLGNAKLTEHRRASCLSKYSAARPKPDYPWSSPDVYECRMCSTSVDAVLLAETGVAVSLGMDGAVFPPKQCYRHALTLELVRHIGPIRLAQLRRRPDDPGLTSGLGSDRARSQSLASSSSRQASTR